MSEPNTNNLRPSSNKKIRWEERKYKKSYIKLQEILDSLQTDQTPESLHGTDPAKYQRYYRLKKVLEKIKTDGIVSQTFMTSIHDEINQSQQEQQISESDLITNIEETLFDNQINNQDHDENGLHVRNDDFFSRYCENFMRKQSRFLVISLTMICTLYISLYGAQMKYQEDKNSNMSKELLEVIDQYIFVKIAIHTYQVKENYQ